MKFSTASAVLATLAVSVLASSAMAANPNGPKPKCPLGQIAVLEDGQYKCKEPSIKPNTKPSMGKAKGGLVKAGPKKPGRAKADFVILSATKVGGTDNKFGVQIKNQGANPTSGGLLQGLNMGDNGGGATAYMPKFKAGETKFVFVEFKTSKFNRQDRVMFHADYKNTVPESNESNNKYTINYQ
ncbi:MAG: CARDB domain-containing protein [Sneathiella sp.]